MEIEVRRGDITTVEVEAIVTAANRELVGGGGVDAAVHRAAGPELLAALRPLAPTPPGSAVITPAFRLYPPIRYVVHAVGPRYGVDDPAEELLAAAYRSSLLRCDETGVGSVAFPAISAGVYGYPPKEACRVSVQALRTADTRVRRCLLVAFGDQMYDLWREALGQ